MDFGLAGADIVPLVVLSDFGRVRPQAAEAEGGCAREGQLTANPGSPCGACRQVMAQYEREAGKPLHIILGSGATIFTLDGVESLMPFVFNDL